MSEKSAETSALLSPFRIISFDGFAPRIRFMESISIDLPAPVSPVSTLKPEPRSMSALLITAIFSICNDESILAPLPPEADSDPFFSYR